MGSNVIFIAPVDQYNVKDTGYGNAAAGIAYVMEKMKESGEIDQISYVNTARFQEAKPIEEMHDIAILVINPYSLIGPRSIIPKIKHFMEKASKKYLSVVWETVPLPKAWKPIWDSGDFDGFLCPSWFVAEQVKQLTDRPVYYYPHYIHEDEIPQVNIQQKIDTEKEFTVLFVGQHTKRKGLEDAVISFTRALGYEADANLILKYHTMTPREMEAVTMIRHAVLCNTGQERPKARIFSVTEMLSREQLCRLYSNSSVLLFCSRGEGFGLPSAEAMCAGIPVIYTSWSSIPEVCVGSPANLAIGCYVDEAHSMLHHGYPVNSSYAVPSMRALMNSLRYCYMSWKKDKGDYYNKSAEGRAIIRKRFGYETVRDCLLNIFNGGENFLPLGLTADWLPAGAAVQGHGVPDVDVANTGRTEGEALTPEREADRLIDEAESEAAGGQATAPAGDTGGDQRVCDHGDTLGHICECDKEPHN